MTFSQNFFKSTSICSFIVGVLILIALLLSFGYTTPTNIEEEIALQDNTAYTTGQWIHLLAVFLAVAAIWGLVAMKMNTAAGLVTTGFIFFMIDIIPSLVFNSMQIFTFNYSWTKELAETTDEAVSARLMTNLHGLYDTGGGILFIALLSFMVGAVLFGLATWKGTGLEKIVGIFFFLVFLADLLWAIGSFGGQEWLSGIMEWISPIVAIILFFVMGAWLWKGKAAA
jgi:small-conductance mechanosensitive channel